MSKYIIQSKRQLKEHTWMDESLPMPLEEADKKVADRMLKVSTTDGRVSFIYRIIVAKGDS